MTTNEQYQEYYDFLAKNVVTPFYYDRLMYLRCTMSLPYVLSHKNPYLLKAKNIASSDELVRSVVDSFLYSQEETMFGNRLETFAIYVSGKMYGGFKSEYPSVDLEFERDGAYYIVGIKSSTNWGNSDQIHRLRDNFKWARDFIRSRGEGKEIIAVNGCIYGKVKKQLREHKDPDKSYYKYAGQDFWNFISGDDDLYREIIKPIDEEARARDEEFKRTYDAKVNSMVKEFSNTFLSGEGLIDWLKLVDFVSKRGKAEVAFPRVKKTDECVQYLKKREEERKRQREEKQQKERLRKQFNQLSS